MKRLNTVAAIAVIVFAAASASSAFAQSGAPGSTPSKPSKVTAVPPPPPPPSGPDKLVTRTQPPVGPRKPMGPIVVDDIAGHPNQTHADLPPGPGTYNCASQNACTWLAAKCDKAGGGMSQNPPDEPGGFPTQTCTIY